MNAVTPPDTAEAAASTGDIVRKRSEGTVTRETAKRMIKGHPLSRQEIAKKDIEEKAYISLQIVPVFEIDGNNYQFTIIYKFRAEDGEYIYGRAMSVDELCKMQQCAARGEVFAVTYLEKSRIIVEIESME